MSHGDPNRAGRRVDDDRVNERYGFDLETKCLGRLVGLCEGDSNRVQSVTQHPRWLASAARPEATIRLGGSGVGFEEKWRRWEVERAR